MRKFLFIILFAFMVLSCEDSAPNQSQSPESSQQEQVVYGDQDKEQDRRTEGIDANKINQDKSKESSVSLIELLMIGLALFLSIISIVLAMQSFRASKYNSDGKIDNLSKDVSDLRIRMKIVEDSIKATQRALTHPTNNLSSTSTRQGAKTNNQYSQQKLDVQEENKTIEQTKDKQEDLSTQKQKESKKAEDSKKYTSKVLYLEINSEDCFFNVSEQKNEASRFIAYIIPGDCAATFELIDVERIRSVNTSKSVKLKGTVPIKDANGIKQQEPGSIHKITDGNGSYWVIDKPVIVEFVK